MGREAELKDRYKSSSFQHTTAVMLRSRALASHRIVLSTILVRNSIGCLVLDIHPIFVCLPLHRSGARMLNLTCTQMCAVYMCTPRSPFLNTQKRGNDVCKASAVKILIISSTGLASDI